MSDTDYVGKVALITGAAHGIGEGVARGLASRGVHVVVADVDDQAGETLAAELGGAFVHTDVSDPQASQDAVGVAVDHFGGLDIVHLNAGVSVPIGLGEDFDLASYRRIMGINLDGVVFGIHAALPVLAERGGGSIVATASMAGLTVAPFDPLYAANKTAVVGLVRSLAGLSEERGVRVNALCPSFADTDIIAGIRSHLVETHFPILEVSDVVDAFCSIIEGDGAGQCWFVVPGRPSEPFGFRNVPGPRVA